MSNENTERKPLYLEITQPEKFEKLAETTFETTQKLAKRINSLFTTAFVDYYGAAVYCTAGNANSGPQFMVELHFKPLPAGAVTDNNRIRAFKPIEEGTAKSDIVANIKNIYGSMRTSAKFQMTRDASEILSEFMLPGVNVDPFNPETYKPFKSEYVDNTQFGQNVVMVKVINLDLTKLVKKIYGSKTEDGKRIDYGIIPHGPVNPNINNQMVQNNANWRVIIMRIDAEKAFDIATDFGIIPASNGSVAPIVTGTR